MLMKTVIVLLCLLCPTTAQWNLFGSGNNVNNVATFLNQFCGDIAHFLPTECGAVAMGPSCCGLFSIVDMCRPSCTRGVSAKRLYGVGHQNLKAIMYDPTVCAALRLAGHNQCQGYGSWTVQCDRLRCLMNMLCFPNYNFACFYRSSTTLVQTKQDYGDDTIQSNTGGTRALVQENCFELPELADGELTGLLNDEESAVRQCPHDIVEPKCKEKKKLRYRTIDGSCNNQHPDKYRWGKSFERQKRLLPAQLVNGQLPRSLDKNGNALPTPRAISSRVSPMRDAFDDVSNMVMAWGQFIDHDFTGTPTIKNGSKAIKCCGDIADGLKVQNGGPCFPIEIPEGDSLAPRTCMQFVRSLPHSFNGTQTEPREQINTLTAFLDASAVYGNRQETLDTLKGEGGLMKVADKNMLPKNPSGTCKKEQEGDYCFLAGDHRVNVFVGLGALHTLFIREHNRIATIFKQLNPAWDDDTVFEETRRIISAQFQRITYVEYLPLVVDEATLINYQLKEGNYHYDDSIDPTIANVFSTAAFRFGHSQVKQAVKIGSRTYTLQNTLMRPGYAMREMAGVIDGLVSAPTDTVDRFFATGLTNHMFETNSTTMDGLDLVSLNIQRGRDHGLPPYNEWREFCKLPRLQSFQTQELTENLGTVYSHVDDIDLFVGMITERHRPGSRVGPTLACLLGHQFRDIKLGDRFFYETQRLQERFTPGQLAEIKKLTLAKVICDNNPEIKEMQLDVFKTADPLTNPITPCNKIPGINLDLWKLP